MKIMHLHSQIIKMVQKSIKLGVKSPPSLPKGPTPQELPLVTVYCVSSQNFLCIDKHA